MRIACASAGQLAAPEGGRVFLTDAEYARLGSSGGKEYSFSLPSGGSLLVLDLADASDSLVSKVPRRTDGPAPATELPPGFVFSPMRSVIGSLPAEEFSAALRATHLVQWRRRTRFCPHCATALRESPTELALQCPACSLIEFPRISPAVIVLIERKGRIVLARNASFTQGMHSLIAGFVEAGESMEETAIRETREEIGIDIGNLRYFGSQDWPFPDSLMVGFRADALSFDLKPDRTEILEAAWFGPDALPPIPRKGSIARAMIDAWLAERGFKTEER